MPGPQSTRSPADGPDAGESPLDPRDAAWLAQRRPTPTMPLVLGVLSIAASPVALGLILGPIGLRASVELWQRRHRGVRVALAAGASLVGVVASVVCAVVWGAVLATVLLGRDAIQTAESWRGLELRSTQVAGGATAAEDAVDLARPSGGAARHALLFVAADCEPCVEALRSLADASRSYPDVPLVVVGQGDARDAARAAMPAVLAERGARFVFVESAATLPPPLDAVAAMPTLVIVARDGRIEKALVGAHPSGDVEKLLRGDAALKPGEATPRGRLR